MDTATASDVHADAVPGFAAVPNHMLTDPFAWIDWCISTWLAWVVDLRERWA